MDDPRFMTGIFIFLWEALNFAINRVYYPGKESIIHLCDKRSFFQFYAS